MQNLQSLARQAQLRHINAQDFHRAIVETIIQRIGSTRASVWYFNEYQDSLECVALYDARTEEFSSGFALHAEDYPAYFRAMVEGDTIVAVDAVRIPLRRVLPKDISTRWILNRFWTFQLLSKAKSPA